MKYSDEINEKSKEIVNSLGGWSYADICELTDTIKRDTRNGCIFNLNKDEW